MEMRPTSSVRRNWLSPRSGSPMRWSSGTQTSSKYSSRVSSPRHPMPRIFGPMVNPAVSFSTTKLANLGACSSSDSVRASSVTPNDMSVPALEMNVLRPLISQPPSRRSARVRMPRASEPASGSVSPNAPSARPSASGRSQRSRWASVPNRYSGKRADRHVGLPGGGHRLVRQSDLLHRGDEADRRHADPAPLLRDSMPRRPSSPISRRRSVGHRASSQASGARGAISFWAKSRQSPTSSRSGSLSEKSIGRSYWTERYNSSTIDAMASDRAPARRSAVQQRR